MGIADDAEKALRMVREASVLVYDTETSGLDWKRNFPIGYVIGSDPKNVVYIPVRHGGGGNLPDKNSVPMSEATGNWKTTDFEKELAKAFKDRTGLTVGHHIKFDAHFSASAGIMLGRNLTCTQNNQALLDEYSRSFSLESCAKSMGVTAKKGDQMYEHLAQKFGGPATQKSMANYWLLPGTDPVAVEYAVGDGVSTLQLYEKQRAEIEEEGMSLIWQVENELIWTLFRMERCGIKVDLSYLDVLRETISERVAAAIRVLPDGFNVRSPVDVKNYMEEHGHTDWPKTEKGNPSFTEHWLKNTDAGQNILTVRKWTNLLNTFVNPLIEEHVYEGRVHSNLNQLKADDHGTVSGRLSCSAPNLQQIPKRDKEIARLFRQAFIPDEGFLFYEADFSQCEPRLFGHYSGEPAIVDGYNSNPPKDMHSVVADMLGVERDPTAKRMNMGILTGMFPKSFAGHMDWDLGTATEKWNQWFQAFPKVRNFQDDAKMVLQTRGFVKTILGRRCRLEKPQFAYRAVSKIIQGSNADILKHKMLELDKMCEQHGKADLMMTVHDSFEWQAQDNQEGRDLSEAMCEVMCDVQSDPFNLRVPFAVDVGSGKNWAEATFGEE